MQSEGSSRPLGRYLKWAEPLLAPFLRYSGAGVIGTIVHYGLLALCVEVFHQSPTLGTVVGAAGGSCFNYGINYRYTFASTRGHGHAFPRFLTVAMIGAALNAAIVEVLSQRLGMYYLLAQVFATGTVLLVGFVINRTWTFGADRESDASSTNR